MVEALGAVLNIPGAIHSLRELLKAKKLDNKAFLNELDTVRNSLLRFSSIGDWFGEVKSLHQNLQHVDVALDPCTQHYAMARPSGIFEANLYPLSTAREDWETAKPHSLERLLESIGAMRVPLSGSPLDDPSWDVRRIRRWGEGIAELKVRIDAMFAIMDRRPPASRDQIQEVAASLKELSDRVKAQMIYIDAAMLKRAASISKALSDLERELKHV